MATQDASAPTRRDVLAAGIGLAAGAKTLCCQSETDLAADTDKALIALTMDLEMSMHYPTWGIMEWNYTKGLLNEATIQYVVEACRRVKARGGVLHSFLLGRTLEQDNVDWLAAIIKEGHPLGNHTYDHVHVWSTATRGLQHRFDRCPWLIHGKTARQVIHENIALTSLALKSRLGVAPCGFRTPGGSSSGLIGREDLQKMLLELGFSWVSSMYCGATVKPEKPDHTDFQAVVGAQKASQPFVYPTGLVEVPMSPIGDVAAFRRKDKKWTIDDFLKMLEQAVRWVIDHRAVFDLLTHPSIMYVEDPRFRAYELVCDLVNRSGGKAAIVGLDVIARRA
jgi:peptidoglycan/xylan/chitin deacetylase (PgdA/CDA1 family)